MKESTNRIFEELFARYPQLECCREDILCVYQLLEQTYRNGGRLYTCGNGGSCSDCEHIVGELMKSFKFKRHVAADTQAALRALGEDGVAMADTLEGALPAVSLCGHPALSTAFLNDTEPTMTFAQQLLGLGRKGDILLSVSTSGNSKNCVYAATMAKALGITSIALTGSKESRLSALCDRTVRVPETETFKIQELHLPIYHALCAMLEDHFFEP